MTPNYGIECLQKYMESEECTLPDAHADVVRSLIADNAKYWEWYTDADRKLNETTAELKEERDKRLAADLALNDTHRRLAAYKAIAAINLSIDEAARLEKHLNGEQ